MWVNLKRLFSRENEDTLPQRVLVIYAHAPEGEPDDSTSIGLFEPPFLPLEKTEKLTPQEFEEMAKVFRNADDAVNHLYRCNQPDMIPCVVYTLVDGFWVEDERATDFFHENHINY